MIHRIIVEYNLNKFDINFELFFGPHKKTWCVYWAVNCKI